MKLTPRAKFLLEQMRDENVLDGIVPNLRAVFLAPISQQHPLLNIWK